MARITRLLHTRYRVNDLEQTVRFYRDVLGLQEVSRHKSPRGSELVFLKAPEGGEEIELCSYPASGPVQVQPDLTHLAFEVDDLEVRRGGLSYTVDTVRDLRRRHPRVRFYFIIGTDSLPELRLWREIDRLVRLCGFIAVARPGFEPGAVGTLGLRPAAGRRFRLRVVVGHLCDVSSSGIRRRVARGESIQYLVTEPVRRYIQQHRLYR